jgi:hypothetical protein
MKRMFSLILVMLLICLPIAVFGADFRNINWGMTKEEVKAIENQKEFKGFIRKVPDNMLIYNNQKIGDIDCQLQYSFVDDKLVMAHYLPTFEPEEVKINFNPFARVNTPEDIYEKARVQAFNAYNKLKELLTIKYGPPCIDTQKWTNETWKNIGGSIPNHIAKGHLIVNSKWSAPNSVVYLDCERDIKSIANIIIVHLYYYESEHYKSLFPEEFIDDEDLKNL